MLKLTQKDYKPIWKWMWLFSFQQLINKYLNHFSMIYDTSVYKIYAVKFFYLENNKIYSISSITIWFFFQL